MLSSPSIARAAGPSQLEVSSTGLLCVWEGVERPDIDERVTVELGAGSLQPTPLPSTSFSPSAPTREHRSRISRQLSFIGTLSLLPAILAGPKAAELLALDLIASGLSKEGVASAAPNASARDRLAVAGAATGAITGGLPGTAVDVRGADVRGGRQRGPRWRVEEGGSMAGRSGWGALGSNETSCRMA